MMKNIALTVFLISLLFSSLLLIGTSRAAADDSLENKVKASYLFHFTQFIDWPEETLENRNRPIRICILGKDPFGPMLDMLEKKKSRGRELIVERVSDSRRLTHCHLVFISASEKEHIKELLHELKTSSVLTVGDMKSFVRRGGIIGFVRKGNKIRIEINLRSAERARLKISAKLLEIAKIVK